MGIDRFLANAFHLAHIDGVQECEATCLVSGRQITQGFLVKKIFSKAMGDVADICRCQSDWVSMETAQCVKASKILRGNLFATPTQGIRPFVSQDNATTDRPSWSVLLRAIPEHTSCMAIFTDESKRRLWPFARVSRYGEQWRPYLNTRQTCPPHIGRELSVRQPIFLKCLDLIEEIYSAGFSKYPILEGLLAVSSAKAIQTIGIQQTRMYEQQLQEYRGTDEFLLAVFVAQKHQPVTVPEQRRWQTQEYRNLW